MWVVNSILNTGVGFRVFAVFALVGAVSQPRISSPEWRNWIQSSTVSCASVTTASCGTAKLFFPIPSSV
jgi:hypothetical protein